MGKFQTLKLQDGLLSLRRWPSKIQRQLGFLEVFNQPIH